MSVTVRNDAGSIPTPRSTGRVVAVATLALGYAVSQPVQADEFTPLCADVEPPYRECWSPVEVAGHEGCHFFGSVLRYHHAPPMVWTGACRNGKAEGEGFLLDWDDNSAEGRLVEGLKDGSWTVTLANGDLFTESHVEGVYHGAWTFDFVDGRFYTVTYENGRMEGLWSRLDDDGYSATGMFEHGKGDGTWTITWPDGVEALVPYENGEIHGEMTVTLDGRPLGTLIYWKGRHVDGVLDPLPLLPDDP